MIYIDEGWSGSLGTVPSPWFATSIGLNGIATCPPYVSGSTTVTQAMDLGFGNLAQTFATNASITVFFWIYWTDQSVADWHICSLWNADPTDPANTRNKVLDVQFEKNNTLSVYCGTKLACNTVGNPYDGYCWQFVQLNAEFSSVGSDLAVNASLTINGITTAQGFANSGIPIAFLFDGQADCNEVSFAAGDLLGGVTVQDFTPAQEGGMSPVPATYPHPGTPIPGGYARNTQTFIESLERPDDASVRVTQTYTEVLERPDNAKARITQTYIEIAGKFSSQHNYTNCWSVNGGGNGTGIN